MELLRIYAGFRSFGFAVFCEHGHSWNGCAQLACASRFEVGCKLSRIVFIRLQAFTWEFLSDEASRNVRDELLFH